MSNMHHVIYIPAPKDINLQKAFKAVSFKNDIAKQKLYTWGDKKSDDQTEAAAIKEQKKGYTQIAGRFGTASALISNMHKKERKNRNDDYTVERSIIYQSPLGGALLGLIDKPNTVLYIDCHGSSVKVGFRPYGLSAEKLARLMVYERLPKTIKRIKIFACYSGEEQNTSEGKESVKFSHANLARGCTSLVTMT